VRRILVDPRNITGSTAVLDDPKQLHHLRRVLRLKAGDRVCCFDGQGAEYAGTISHLTQAQMTVRLDQRLAAGARGRIVWLAPGLIKSPRFDWLIQKATELGVSRLSPIVTERTVIRLTDTQGRQKRERWRRLAEAASKQCGRADVPSIDPPQSFHALLPLLGRVPLVLIPTLEVAARPFRDMLEGSRAAGDVAVLIGPEGDFSPAEVAAAVKTGAQPVSLGRLTLRSETAALACLAILSCTLPRG